MIAGGSEASITPMGVGGFAAMRALSTRNDEPQRASRPFDKDRDGFVCGEGAGILVLEELEFAKARGATIYAEIVGYGLSGDAFHLTAQPEDAQRRRAVDADGAAQGGDPARARSTTSTPTARRRRSTTRPRRWRSRPRSASTRRKLVMSSTKSMTGHLLGAAGGLEAGITALAIRHQIAPPTDQSRRAGSGVRPRLRGQRVKRPMKIDYALSNSFGFGGTNGTLLMKRYE